MESRSRYCFFLLLIAASFCYADVKEKNPIGRSNEPENPVLTIFKEQGVVLYKTDYLEGNKCPSFYVKFRFDPRTSTDSYFRRLYVDVFSANSEKPYSLVDEEDDLRINVGWRGRFERVMDVSFDKAAAKPKCEEESMGPSD